MEKRWTDKTKMPFGVNRGIELINIPDEYFKWFWKNNSLWYNNKKKTMNSNTIWTPYDKNRFAMMDYIEDTFDKSELV